MKSKVFGSISILVLVFMSYKVGYQSGYNHARYGAVIQAFDGPDIPGQGTGKSDYEPYFTKRNEIPATIK
jgi:hypothetical protein